jgi:hypothetical protein
MQRIFRLVPLALLLLTGACGTLNVELITNFTPTPNPTAQPAWMSLGFPSPEQCSQFVTDTLLPKSPDNPRAYIGENYVKPYLPEGLAFRGGDTIDERYLWEWVSRPKVDMEFILEITCLMPDGSPYGMVVDAIKIPQERPGYGRAGYCLPDRASGPFRIFGRFDINEPQVTLGAEKGWKMYNLDFAQQIDLATMRFAPLSLEGVACLRLIRQGS